MSDSRIIQPDHNVYILGAGFSRDAGLPLLGDFLEKMWVAYARLGEMASVLNSEKPLSGEPSAEWKAKHENVLLRQRAIERVHEFRSRAASACFRIPLNVDNIEELFSLAAAREDPEVMDDIILSIMATLETSEERSAVPTMDLSVSDEGRGSFMPRKWSSAINSPRGVGTFRVPVYEYYAAILSGALCRDSGAAIFAPQAQQNTIITFNYDTLLDRALDAIGLRVDYVTEDENRKSYQQYNRQALFKIHGSLHFSHDDESKPHLCDIVPPTWRKNTVGDLQRVFRSAVAALSTARRIIILGFSIPPTDAHFKYLVSAGLMAHSNPLDVFFVNPAADSLQDNIFSVFREDMVDRNCLHIIGGREGYTDHFLQSPETLAWINRPLVTGWSNNHA